MDGELFVLSLIGKAAVVDPLIVSRLFQMPIDCFSPGFPPLEQLFFAVPFGSDGILPAKLCALGVFFGDCNMRLGDGNAGLGDGNTDFFEDPYRS